MVCLAGILLGAQAAQASHTPLNWFDTVCSGSTTIRCWHPIPNASNPVRDLTAGQGDASKATAPNPSSADIWSGASNTLNSVYFGYDDNGTTTADDDVMFFRMRLFDTPGLGGANPGSQADGPYDANTTWNFVLDINGDGWVDFINTTDGKSGKNQDPSDDMVLFRNTSTSQQNVTNSANCTSGGSMLWTHDSVDTANDVCTSNTASPCDFKFTRIYNDSANSGGYFLDMQFPLSIFDTCSGSDTDGDGIGGSQVLTPTSNFMFCATTSTQPQDPSNKDLGATGTYNMSSTRRLPCGDNCSLAGGCVNPPVVTAFSRACGTGTNSSPITLTATVMDTLIPNGAGTDVIDSIQDVAIYYQQDGSGNPFTLAAAASGTNPVTSPGSQPSLWSMSWNTSALPTSPTPNYWIQVVATDNDGNVASSVPALIDISTCTITTTPVTLASFNAERQDGKVRFRWTTATEAGNVGFNLYARTDKGLRRINAVPIPSKKIDSLEPQSYSYETSDEDFQAYDLYIEDVDVQGRGRMHGPFGFARGYGRKVELDRIDWDSIRQAVSQEVRKVTGATKGGAAATSAAADLRVDRDGLYRVTYEALAAAGIDLAGVAADDLALTLRGAPVPMSVSAGGGAKAVFGPGSAIEFVGKGLDTLYTATNVYRLSVDRQLARRAQVDTRAPRKGAASPSWYQETATVERELEYSFASPNGDPWYDTSMLVFNSPQEFTFSTSLDGLVAAGGPATLRVGLWGVTDWPQAPDHRTVLRFNGLQVADELFDGLSDHQIAVQLPAGLPQEGANTLTVRMPADTGVDYDLVNLDRWSVTYPRAFIARQGRLSFQGTAEAFRVTGLPGADPIIYRSQGDRLTRLAPSDPASAGGSWSVSLAGDKTQEATYWVSAPSALLTPGIAPSRDGSGITAPGSAKYLVISHSSFLSGLAPLITERQAQGLTTRVVDVEDVFARFSQGVFDAKAIQDYVAWAAANLGTEYVLLVGGDTYDYRNFLGQGSISFVPSLYSETSHIVKFTPADPLFGDVDGDGLTDVAIGRLPVRTAAELDSVVGKTLDYARKSYSRTALFAADALDPNSDVSFTQVSDNFVRQLPADWTAEKAYIDELGLGGARGALMSALNSGVALTTFVGHSGPTAWTFSGLFNAGDAMQLTNAGRPTVVSQWGCWNTWYVAPGFDTLGHKLLLSGDRGAAAVLGATALTEVASDHELGLLLSRRLTQPGMTIGKAILDAKRELAIRHPEMLDVLVGWTILGDPALSVEP